MMLTCKELTDYLSLFDADEGVAVVVADIEKRLRYKISGYQLFVDTPALLLETTETLQFDEFAEELQESE